MANYKVVDADKLDSNLKGLADKLRAKTNTEDEIAFPEGFETALDNVGEDLDTEIAEQEALIAELKETLAGKAASKPAVIEPLSVTENGTYSPPEGVDGYAPVKVEIVDPPVGTSMQDFVDARRSLAYLFHVAYRQTPTTIIDPNSYITYELVDRVFRGVNTESVVSCCYMFQQCGKLEGVPLFDTKSVVDMAEMFTYCGSLTAIPLFDTSSVVNMDGMFEGCAKLTSVPLFNTRSVTRMQYMFNGCVSLISIPLFDLSSVTNFYGVFSGCTSLQIVPSLDLRSCRSLDSAFNNCKALIEIWIRNIKTALQVGSGTSYGHLLTVESLIHLIYELRDTGSVKKLTVGTANMEKLASVYVKTIDVTDEMRAEDDLVDEKLPFVVCESTDEGATLITEYVLAKNWELA